LQTVIFQKTAIPIKKLITTVNIGVKVAQVKCKLTRSNDDFNIFPVLKHHEEVKIHRFNLGSLEPFTSLEGSEWFYPSTACRRKKLTYTLDVILAGPHRQFGCGSKKKKINSFTLSRTEPIVFILFTQI
jgi:hypothetical protein